MNNALRIAEAVDRHLTEKTEIVVFGSAALMLDPRYAERFSARVTNDVDIIIPAERELRVEADLGFWRAIEVANKELEAEGLYVTHIFPEREVTLTPDWEAHAIRLETPGLKNLSICRPHVIDLVISKMGRGDAQDIEDVRTWLRLEHEVSGQAITAADLRRHAERARIPEVYREIFPLARERVIASVEQSERVQTLHSVLKMAQKETPRQSRGIRP